MSSLNDTDLVAAKAAAVGMGAALVFITADSGEGYLTVENNAGDRNDMFAWHGGDAVGLMQLWSWETWLANLGLLLPARRSRRFR